MRLCQIVFLAVLSLLVIAPIDGQSPNGTISGIVVDPSGAAIVGAEILIANDATGVQYPGKTNGEGFYLVPSIPPGTYRLQVSKVGFKTLIKPDITLNVQDALGINFTLPVGAASVIVTVEGGAPMINTTDASVGTVVDRKYVENMPLNGRSFQDLILLTPGAVTQTPQAVSTSGLGLTGEFSVNGQRPESNYYTVDGVSANVGATSSVSNTNRASPSGSLPASTALGTTQALVSVDDLQEFRVRSSSYSAEYGRNPGGQFAFETKSGTNQWHGTAYDYLRNGAVDAQDWFSNYFGVKQPALRQNDFGGTLGGPIEIPGLYKGKDKTFFFFSYEGLRLTAPQAAVASPVPDFCMRGMSVCPAGRKPAATALQPVVNAFPLPSPNGLADAANGVGQFVGSWSNRSSLDSISVRLDHSINDKLRLFFRFSNTSSSTTTRRPFITTPPTYLQTTDTALRTYTAGAASLLSNHVSNDFRLNYSSNEVISPVYISPFGGSTALNLLQTVGLVSDSQSLLFFSLGPSFFILSQGPQSGTQSQWNLIDTISLALGRHQVKFGADFRRLAPSEHPSPLLAQYGFTSESAVESNTPNVFLQSKNPAYPLYRNFSAFAQDEWRISSRLNLSLGMRWEVNPAPSAWQGLRAYALNGTGPANWTPARQGTLLWNTTWGNFAPRLGVTYVQRTSPGYETVVRGGGGVFYDTGQQLGTMAFSGLGFSASTTPSIQFPGDPSALAPPILNPPVGRLGSTIQVPTRNLQLPYTVQWNASIEQALGNAQALTFSYVGSHAARLLRLTEFPGSASSISALFRIAQNGLTSDYDSLQAQFQRKLSRGLTALASYTWSHCLDYGSQDYAYGYRRGNCDFDVRHSLSGAFSYDLPNPGQDRFANAVLRHWGFDDRIIARTSFPVTLNGQTLILPDGENFHAGLNLVPGQPTYLYGADCASKLLALGDLKPGLTCPGGRAVNPLAFANVTSGLGNAPRNFVRGFSAWQMNLAARREFPIYERLTLQFRAEAFNVFNHPNFGTINSGFGQQTFGQATSTLANSLGILNPLYQAGGPRSMQFGLKLLF